MTCPAIRKRKRAWSKPFANVRTFSGKRTAAQRVTQRNTGIARAISIYARAYVLWEQEGCPEGQADEYWRSVRDFEAK
jgi:hypothetical protein